MPRLIDHGLTKEKKPKKAKASKPKGEPKKKGRPTLYTEALDKEICLRLSQGESLLSICKSEHIPEESTVRGWAINPEHPFSANYTRARETGYYRMADELIEISDNSTNDYIERAKEEGSSILVDHDHISRSRLRVETRKWILSKMLPKIYGDKLQLQGDKENPIQHEHGVRWMTEEEAKARGWA